MTTCNDMHIRGLELLIKSLDKQIEDNSEKNGVHYDAIRVLLRHIYDKEGIAVIRMLSDKIQKEVDNVPYADWLMHFLYDFEYDWHYSTSNWGQR